MGFGIAGTERGLKYHVCGTAGLLTYAKQLRNNRAKTMIHPGLFTHNRARSRISRTGVQIHKIGGGFVNFRSKSLIFLK